MARRFCAAVYSATAKVMINSMVRTVFLSSFKLRSPPCLRYCIYDTIIHRVLHLRKRPARPDAENPGGAGPRGSRAF